MKSLSPNWPMWGSENTTTKRNSSTSSTVVAAGDAWIGQRSSSGSWENAQSGEVSTNSSLDFSQLESQSHPLSSPLSQNTRHIRAVPRIVGEDSKLNTAMSPDTNDRSHVLAKSASLSAQRFEGGKAASSPTRPPGYGMQASFTQPIPPSSLIGTTVYGPNHGSISVDDLALGFRGMAVEEDHSPSQQNVFYRPEDSASASMQPPMQIRAPLLQTQQPQFNMYTPQADYTAYYAGSSAADFPYGYDYRVSHDPPLYGSPIIASNMASGTLYSVAQPLHPSLHASADLHRQAQGMYYDYNTASARPPGSPYYYPSHPPVLFHHGAPTHSPSMQLLGGGPAVVDVKKQRFNSPQYNTHQGMLMQSARHSTPSPHSQSYSPGIEYGGSHSVMVPVSTLFGNPQMNTSTLALYPQPVRPARRVLETAVILRSPVLEEFRVNKARKWELQDIFGYIVEFSGDQHGSRFLQQKLETASTEEKQIVFDELVPDNVLQLIMDVFGNYVIQKLFEHGTQLQKSILINAMEGHILSLSLQMYGCRVVQKAIECALPEQQAIFVKELDPHVHRCVRDANGNHVIQKLIERVPSERLPFIHLLKGYVYELSTHPYGCRVLQRCFEHFDENRARPLLDEVHKYAVNLMQDQFGNYVMQFILENGKPQDKALIISKLRGQLLHMARHKFASNVCEKALTAADAENRRFLIDEILTPRADGVSPIVTMMKDQFANYVLQRALAVVEGDQKELLIAKIKQQLLTMRRYSSVYSKHLTSIERSLEKSTTQKSAESSTADVPSERKS